VMNDNEGIEKESWAQSVTNSPNIVLQLQILQKREGFIGSVQAQTMRAARNSTLDTAKVRGWLMALYLELYGSLKRDMLKDDLKKIETALDSDELKDLTEAFFVLSVWLDTKKLTRFDTRGGYDRTRVEVENKHHGI